MSERIGFARTALVLVAVGIGTLSAAGADINIDNFNSASAPWPLDQNTINDPQVEAFNPGSGVLGDVRKTYIRDFLPGGGISRVEVGVFPAPQPGFFDFAASVGTQATLALRYDADPNPDGLNPALNLDMIANSTIEIVFSYFDYANAAPLDVSVTVSDGSGATMQSQALGQIVNFPTTYTMSFDFSTRAGQVDFGDINSIEIEFDPGESADFRIQQITATPEPASAVLLALGALAIRRRRRRS